MTTHGFTFTVDSAYDDANRRTKITYPDSSFVDREYTVRDQLETIEYTNTPAGGSLTSFETLAVVYDAGMRVTDRDSGNGVEAGYAYRDDNLTETITHTGVNNFSNGANGLDFTYDYDANKNKLQETITSPVAGYGFNSSADAVYDDEDRLTEWNRDDTNRDLEWDLSLVGDWDQFTVEGTGVSRTHAAAHELTAVGAASLSLDVKGNITQDTTKTNTHNYTWDFDNQLALADVDGTGGDEIEYTYDALGRRVSKKFPQGEDTCTILFVHSGQQILAEYKWEAATREKDSIKQQQQRTVAIGVVTTNASATVTLLRKYQYASYIDDRCVLVDLTALGAVAAGTEELFWQHANHLYSVAALTDAAANLVERYTYDAYGNITILDPAGTTVRTVSSYGNPYTFTGRRLDDETGIYHYRARYYDSELGRFISRDSLGYVDGLSLYRGYFVPNGLDPSGLVDWMMMQQPDGKYGGSGGLVEEGSILGRFFTWRRENLARREAEYQQRVRAKELGDAYLGGLHGKFHGMDTAELRGNELRNREMPRGNPIYNLSEAMTRLEKDTLQAATGLSHDEAVVGLIKVTIKSTGQDIQHPDQWYLNHPGRAPFDYAVGAASNPFTYAGVASVVVAKCPHRLGRALPDAPKGAVTRFGPHVEGPLSTRVAGTFRGGSYSEVVLGSETALYRVYGGGAGKVGPYWTRVKPSGPLQSQLDSALVPAWGNTAENVVTIRVPAGTKIFEGAAAPQSTGVGQLLGGGNQVYIPRVDPNWIVP